MELHLADQAVFDSLRFDHPGGYDYASPQVNKAVHIMTHLNNITGNKLLDWAFYGIDEPTVINEVMPDLAVYRSQIINTFSLTQNPDFALAKAYDGERDKLTYQYHAAKAGGYLAKVLEPKMHKSSPVTMGEEMKLILAVDHLHISALGLAAHFGLSLPEAHAKRISLVDLN